jgi:hypothetical protein
MNNYANIRKHSQLDYFYFFIVFLLCYEIRINTKRLTTGN